MGAAISQPGVRAEELTRRGMTLVWVDSREAIVMRWRAVAAETTRIRSDVPAHHRATGSVRHRPDVRHGGGGVPQTAGEPRRLEHLERFLTSVMELVPVADDVLLLGPGTVHEHLAQRLRDHDADQHLQREIRSEAAARLTRPQLLARLRRAVGKEPRRRTVGAYRWSRPLPAERSGRHGDVPLRVAAARRPIRQEPSLED